MNARDDDRDKGEGFLGRWIKRKAQAREAHEAPEVENSDVSQAQAAHAQEDAGEAPEASAKEPAEPPFDLSRLPGLDDITAETNLSDFMRKEVPAALRNAALKRAWALDPAIRDYVNPAREYAFDWNTPGGVPGNGPLEAAYDALKQVAEAFQSQIPDDTLGVGEVTVEQVDGEIGQKESAPPSASPVRLSGPSDARGSSQVIAGASISDSSDKPSQQREVAVSDVNRPPRRHGGAAPV